MLKNLNLWLPSYIRQRLQSFKDDLSADYIPRQGKTKHILFCFVDHWEPDWNNASIDKQRQRVRTWCEQYPVLAKKHRDADGCYPKHSFFYPAEMYLAEHLYQLRILCDHGVGEVEIHLHHDGDTAETLSAKLIEGRDKFAQHNFLGRDKKTGAIRYAFIHGNWALNNSRPDGKWCGVNDECRILRETGCYADFTFPSAPSDTQTTKINSIYYASGCADKPKGHDRGPDVRVGGKEEGELMLIQGPLALNWERRKYGLLPRIENSDVTGANPPTPDRVDLWVDQGISVKGRSEWIFIKVHTHGATERNAPTLLGDPMHRMLDYLESKYNDGKHYVLHYVSAREMYNIAKAAEDNQTGSPNEYRNYLIEPNT